LKVLTLITNLPAQNINSTQVLQRNNLNNSKQNLILASSYVSCAVNSIMRSLNFCDDSDLNYCYRTALSRNY